MPRNFTRKGRSKPADRGFVLPGVLLAVVALSVLAVSLSRRSSADASAMVRQAALIEAKVAADAGIQRMLAAFLDKQDPLAPVLATYGGEAQWTFHGVPVRLRTIAESGKVDILLGDQAMRDYIIRATIKDKTLADDVLERIQMAQRDRLLPDRIEALLPPQARLSGLGERLSQSLTIFSGQSGIDPLSSPPAVREALLATRPGLKEALANSVKLGFITADLAAGLSGNLAPHRSIYSLDAQAILLNGTVARRGVLIAIEGNERTLHIERSFELSPEIDQR